MSHKNLFAALLVSAIALTGLTACSDSTSVEATPEPTQTTPSPTRTSESPSPTPMPSAVATFEATDRQGYVYEYVVEQLPEFYATIDTTQGPPGYTMVEISYQSIGRISITNKTPGGKVAPEIRNVQIVPVWTPIEPDEKSTEDAYDEALSAQYANTGYRDAQRAWDWENNLERSGDRWIEPNSLPAVQREARSEFSYENGPWTQFYKNSYYMHGDRENKYEGVYVVQEDQAEAFAKVFTQPAGFILQGPFGSEDRTVWDYENDEIVYDKNFYRNYFFIPYKAPAGEDLVNYGTIY